MLSKKSLVRACRHLVDMVANPISMIGLGLIATSCLLGLLILADQDRQLSPLSPRPIDIEGADPPKVGSKTATVGSIQFRLDEFNCSGNRRTKQCLLKYKYSNIGDQVLELPTPCSLPSHQAIIDKSGAIHKAQDQGCIQVVLHINPGEAYDTNSVFELPTTANPDRVRWSASATGPSIDMNLESD